MIFNDLRIILQVVPTLLPAFCISTLRNFAPRKQKRRVMSKNQQKQRHLEIEIRKLRRDVEELAKLNDIGFDKVYLTKDAAAKTIGISKRTIERWQSSGYIRRVTLGGRVFFSKREILRVAQLYNYGIGELMDNSEFMPFAANSRILTEDLKITLS